MLTEPTIDKKVIRTAIEENYTMKVTDLSFVPGGETSWGYKVETQGGRTYFLKIYTSLEESEKRFDLTYRLFESGITHIAHPLKTQRGNLVIYIERYPTALFDFISGYTADDVQLDSQQRFALGVLLGRIHKAKDIIGEFSLKEDFKYGNTNRLLETLEKAKIFVHDKSQYRSRAATLLLENKEKILTRLEALEALGNKLRKKQLDFVICHGEPHRWNTLVNEQGEVFLIDWDDSLFAPREKDLNDIKDDPVILDGYKSIVGEIKLNEDVLHYYNMEWNISEIDAWSATIFYSEWNDTQNQHFLEEFISDLDELNLF